MVICLKHNAEIATKNIVVQLCKEKIFVSVKLELPNKLTEVTQPLP